jgi:hypothetical protein
MNKYNFFSVESSGDKDDQLSKAVASYIFDIIRLGLKLPNTNLGVYELEHRAQNAFDGVLGELDVRISVDETGQNIKVSLE